jgi:hypothetical protein
MPVKRHFTDVTHRGLQRLAHRLRRAFDDEEIGPLSRKGRGAWECGDV